MRNDGGWAEDSEGEAPNTLSENLILVSSAHMAVHNHLSLQFQKTWCPLLASVGTAHMW